MKHRAPESAEGDRTEPGGGPALIQALASALKNIAIYPAAHPRVTTAATDALQRLRARAGQQRTITVSVRGHELDVAGALVPIDTVEADWLVTRLRDAGLRGVEFDVDCSVADVTEFAAMLNRCRARTRDLLLSQWQADHPRLRPLPLVFSGRYMEGAAPEDGLDDSVPEDGNTSTATDPAPRNHMRAVLERLSADDRIRQQLKAIESNTADSEAPFDRSIDLIDAIGRLLPAEVSNDPDQIEKIVKQVLSRVEDVLGALVHRNAKVKGGDLLRMALDVARKYFLTEAPQQTQRKDLPSGRPEDDGIVANLDLLMQEMTELPDADDLRLPPPTDFDQASPTMRRELCGVFLHTLCNSTNPIVTQAVAVRLGPTVRALGGLGGELIDEYLKPQDGAAPVEESARMRILRALVEAGLEPLVRSNGYVDAPFVARGFPELLPMVSRVLGEDERGLQTIRHGLEMLATMLPLGGVSAAAKAGVLLDPVVVTTLVAIGGDLVMPFLPHAATHGSRQVRQLLLDLARTLPLPEPEAAALGSVASVDELPRDYLQNLLAAAAQKKFDGAQRAATGRLLRTTVERNEGRTGAAYLAAIDNLRHVPGPETHALLKGLATAGRFTQLGPQARAIRQHARSVLQHLASMQS